MKQGRSLVELASELERQSKAKHDYKVPTTEMAMEVDRADAESKPQVGVKINGFGTFHPTEIFHDQIGTHLSIPAKYYDRMLTESPELLATNVNHWLRAEPETRLVRTLDSNARAFLSNRYRTIDNYDVADAVLPALVNHGAGLRVESSEVTDRRLYIKAVSERIQGTVVGQAVQAMISISNSEVGLGAFRIEFGLFILRCLNGAIMPEEGMRRYHVGRAGAEFDSAYEVFSDSTRQADDRALKFKMADVVRAAFDDRRFQQLIQGVSITGQNRIEKNPAAVIEKVVEENALSEKDNGGILRHLINGGDLTQWGLSNAVTAYAQEQHHTYEQATELEKIGGRILTIKPEVWTQLASAA